MQQTRQTDFTRQETKINALTFEVHDINGKLKTWTHGQEDEKIKNGLPEKFTGTSLTLPLYPQELMRNQAIRTSVTQSIGFSEDYQPVGIVDNWGMNAPKWTIKGHTGWVLRKIGNIEIDGYTAYIALYNFFVNYQKENFHRIKSQKDKSKVNIVMFNWPDSFQDFWYVEPLAIPTKMRNISKPLYYQYEINLIGVKPFSNHEKVVDPIALIVGDNESRIKAIHNVLDDKTTELNTYTDASYLPKKLQNSMTSVITEVKGIKDLIATNLSGVKNVLTTVNNTITEIITFENDLKNAVTNVLSPIYDIVYIVNDIKCGLQTLATLPLDFYSELSSDVENLISALKGSGCSTTLGTGKAGWASLK